MAHLTSNLFLKQLRMQFNWQSKRTLFIYCLSIHLEHTSEKIKNKLTIYKLHNPHKNSTDVIVNIIKVEATMLEINIHYIVVNMGLMKIPIIKGYLHKPPPPEMLLQPGRNTECCPLLLALMTSGLFEPYPAFFHVSALKSQS